MAKRKSKAADGVIRDLDMLVEVDGEMVRIRDLVDTVLNAGEMLPEIDTLRAFQEATNRFIRRDGEQHEIADAASKMLAGIGYSDEEIKEYVEDWVRAQDERGTSAEIHGDQEDRRVAVLTRSTNEPTVTIPLAYFERIVRVYYESQSDI